MSVCIPAPEAVSNIRRKKLLNRFNMVLAVNIMGKHGLT